MSDHETTTKTLCPISGSVNFANPLVGPTTKGSVSHVDSITNTRMWCSGSAHRIASKSIAARVADTLSVRDANTTSYNTSTISKTSGLKECCVDCRVKLTRNLFQMKLKMSDEYTFILI